MNVSVGVFNQELFETYDAQVASAPKKATINPDIMAGPPPLTKGVTKNLDFPSKFIPIVTKLQREALTGWRIPKYTSLLW